MQKQSKIFLLFCLCLMFLPNLVNAESYDGIIVETSENSYQLSDSDAYTLVNKPRYAHNADINGVKFISNYVEIYLPDLTNNDIELTPNDNTNDIAGCLETVNDKIFYGLRVNTTAPTNLNVFTNDRDLRNRDCNVSILFKIDNMKTNYYVQIRNETKSLYVGMSYYNDSAFVIQLTNSTASYIKGFIARNSNSIYLMRLCLIDSFDKMRANITDITNNITVEYEIFNFLGGIYDSIITFRQYRYSAAENEVIIFGMDSNAILVENLALVGSLTQQYDTTYTNERILETYELTGQTYGLNDYGLYDSYDDNYTADRFLMEKNADWQIINSVGNAKDIFNSSKIKSQYYKTGSFVIAEANSDYDSEPIKFYNSTFTNHAYTNMFQNLIFEVDLSGNDNISFVFWYSNIIYIQITFCDENDMFYIDIPSSTTFSHAGTDISAYNLELDKSVSVEASLRYVDENNVYTFIRVRIDDKIVFTYADNEEFEEEFGIWQGNETSTCWIDDSRLGFSTELSNYPIIRLISYSCYPNLVEFASYKNMIEFLPKYYQNSFDLTYTFDSFNYFLNHNITEFLLYQLNISKSFNNASNIEYEYLIIKDIDDNIVSDNEFPFIETNPPIFLENLTVYFDIIVESSSISLEIVISATEYWFINWEIVEVGWFSVLMKGIAPLSIIIVFAIAGYHFFKIKGVICAIALSFIILYFMSMINLVSAIMLVVVMIVMLIYHIKRKGANIDV